MRIIQTSNGTEFIVDDEDFERLSLFKWNDTSRKSIFRSERSKLSARIKYTSLASEVMQKPHVKFDHKDRDYTNNRKDNLREYKYHGDNMANRLKFKGKYSSKYKGVSWHKQRKKWIASISIDNTRKHIGCFDNEDMAAYAYDKKAFEVHGEFAQLNFNTSDIKGKLV